MPVRFFAPGNSAEHHQLPIACAMKSTSLTSTTESPSESTSSLPHSDLRAFNVVAFYNDLSDGLHAKAVFERLKNTLLSFVHVNTFAWSVQQLEREEVRSKASQIVRHAGMVVIASHAKQFPRGDIAQWLDDCLADRSPDAPLFVALDGGDSSYGNGTGAVMDEFAGRHGSKIIHNEKFEEAINFSSALQWVCSQPVYANGSWKNPSVRASRVPRHFGIND
jgi:hypothetical protein